MRRKALLVIFSLLTTAMLVATASSARAVQGRTLYFKQAARGQVSKSVVARTGEDEVAVYQSPKPRVYVQYDGKSLWACKAGKECRIAARGAEAKKGSEVIEGNFFDPWGKYGLASAFMNDPKPSGNRTVAGIASSCKSSASSLEPEQINTLCISKREGFLTLLEAGEETWTLQRTLDYVKDFFLRIPKGVWNGHLRG